MVADKRKWNNPTLAFLLLLARNRFWRPPLLLLSPSTRAEGGRPIFDVVIDRKISQIERDSDNERGRQRERERETVDIEIERNRLQYGERKRES